MFFVFLSSYRNTRKSLGELEEAVETLASRAARVPTAFLVLPNFHSCFYNSIENTVHVFYFLSDSTEGILQTEWKIQVTLLSLKPTIIL